MSQNLPSDGTKHMTESHVSLQLKVKGASCFCFCATQVVPGDNMSSDSYLLTNMTSIVCIAAEGWSR